MFQKLKNTLYSFFTTGHRLSDNEEDIKEIKSKSDKNENQIIELRKEIEHSKQITTIEKQLQYQAGQVDSIQNILGLKDGNIKLSKE